MTRTAWPKCGAASQAAAASHAASSRVEEGRSETPPQAEGLPHSQSHGA